MAQPPSHEAGTEPAGDAASGAVGLSRDVYTLLAHANLHRMRGQWPEAVEKCMAAMRLAPDNPTAQSLLGDIYEDQGLLDDAVQWYRMALDASPDSPADRLKLDRLLQIQQAVRSAGKTLSLPPDEPPLAALPRRADPDALLRFAARAVTLLVLLVVVLAAVQSHRRTGPMPAGSVRHQIEEPGVVIPTVAPLTDPAPVPSAAPRRDPAEQALLQALQSVPDLASQDIAVVDVQTDPRTSRVVVTTTCQLASLPALTRIALLRTNTRVLEAAARKSEARTAAQFTVRCLLASARPGSANGIPLVFVADGTREDILSVPADVDALPESRLQALYTNVWWSSTYFP